MIKYNLTDQDLLDLTVGEFTIYSKRYTEVLLWEMVLAARNRRKKLVKMQINPYFTYKEKDVFKFKKTISTFTSFKVKFKVVASGCWEWQTSTMGKGYGNFYADGKTIGAHIYSYTHYIGEIPKGMMVCHSCDNPKCVNPDHLFLGTNQDNMQDASKKGRLRRKK